MIYRLIAICLILVCTLTSSGIASAISSTDQQSIYTNSEFYWGNQPTCSANATTTAAITGANSSASTGPIWSSNTQPPYYLESFAINVLEDVATKLGAPQSSAVTQQHVLALVAWAYAEGGNIANTSGIFNPWNNGLNDPALLAGASNASGVQGFKSFDAGVEANAIVLTAPNQRRIGQALVNPTSSASDIMHAIAYYNQYPGNQEWAGSPIPVYAKLLNNNLATAQSKYATEASVVIGPGQENTNHVPASQLQFNNGALLSTSSGTNSGTLTSNSNASGGCCSSSAVAQPATVPTGSASSLSANAQPAFTYLTQHNIGALQAAAMVGNWQQESNVGPTTPGGGLAQWGGSRYTNMQAFVSAEGKPVSSLDGQIDFALHELNTGYTRALTAINSDTTIAAATTDFMNDYELPYAPLANLAGRINYANTAFSNFAGNSQGSAATAQLSSCGGAAGGTGTYMNPLRGVTSLRPSRIDMGVDYTGSGPVYSLGDGTVENLHNSGWPDGGFITVKLTDGPAAGDYVYTSEGCPPTPGLAIGQQVTTSSVICNMLGGGTSIEIGWAQPPGNGNTYAESVPGNYASGEFNGGNSTSFGDNFNLLLVSLGAPSGINQDPAHGNNGGPLPAGWPTSW